MKPGDRKDPEAADLTDFIVELFELTFAERFQPFAVVMLDGRRYFVPTRDHVAISYDAFGEPDEDFFVLGDDGSAPRLRLFSIATIELL